MPGYHFIIKPNGEAVSLVPVEQVSNGVAGFNSQSIHIAYIGGIDEKNSATDNRTAAQKATILKLVSALKKNFPNATVQGHRDFPNVKKACPSFDAKKEYKDVQ